MAYRLLGVMLLAAPVIAYCHFDSQQKISAEFSLNANSFVRENTFENVFCKMAAILSRTEYVDKFMIYHG